MRYNKGLSGLLAGGAAGLVLGLAAFSTPALVCIGFSVLSDIACDFFQAKK